MERFEVTSRSGRHVRIMFLVAMTTVFCLVDSEEISDLDMPIPTAQVTGVSGREAALPCDTRPLSAGDALAMVLWFREPDWEPLYSYDVRGRSASQPKLWSSSSGFGPRAFFRASAAPAALLVQGVSPADAGIYRCRVDFRNSPTRNLRINFTVVTPPNRPIIMEARTRDVTRLLQPYDEGDTLELLCEVYGGDPRPSVIWYLENTVIDDSFEQRADGITVNTLTFPNVGRQHLNARLVCQASNTNLAPPQTKLLILDINLRPLSVRILNKRAALSAERAYEVRCESAGSRPPALLSWWKNSQQLTKNIRNFSEANSSHSVLRLVAQAADDHAELVCRADNPRLAGASLQDSWNLTVHYVPLVRLRLGSEVSPQLLREGDDVYLECSALGNPPPDNYVWYKDNSELVGNASAGVVVAGARAVVRGARRGAAGEYSCAASNPEGSATSNLLTLAFAYAPRCSSSEVVVGTIEGEEVEVQCEVDSNPEPDQFHWTFNSSTNYMEIDPSMYEWSEFTSRLRWRAGELGVLSCWADNSAGQQTQPCLFTLVAAEVPSPLHNCSVVNQSVGVVGVRCEGGSDGGLPQRFHLEVLELPSMTLQANVSSNSSELWADGVFGARYLLNVYATNAKGRSDVTTLYTLISPDRYTDPSRPLAVSPTLACAGAAGALLLAAVCALLAAACRKRAAENKRPSNNALYPEDCLDPFPKRDPLSTYTSSAKVDFVHNLKDPDEEPDIIPVHYAKKLEELKSCSPSNVTCRVFEDRINKFHTNYNASLVNRGVTARAVDITSSRPPAVRESCI